MRTRTTGRLITATALSLVVLGGTATMASAEDNRTRYQECASRIAQNSTSTAKYSAHTVRHAVTTGGRNYYRDPWFTTGYHSNTWNTPGGEMTYTTNGYFSAIGATCRT